MIPVEDVQALRAEAVALRAEVREVVAILENWNSIEPGAGDLEMDPIPADECRTLEAIIKDDLQRAKILSVSVYVDEDGSIEVEELALRIYGGREVVLAPEMRSKAPVIALEINPGDGWRDMTVEEDYSEELEELTAEPWHPEPPEPWDRE